MKSIYKIIFSSLILMGLMTSCFDKFLEEDVYDFLSPNNFYKTEADAEAAVNAIYSRLVSSEDNDISFHLLKPRLYLTDSHSNSILGLLIRTV